MFCGKCYVIDGDIIYINFIWIWFVGIDVLELEDFWGKKVKWEMVFICKGKVIIVKFVYDKFYDCIVVICFFLDGIDISVEFVWWGFVLDWVKFFGGKYCYFEFVGVCKKLWWVVVKY